VQAPKRGVELRHVPNDGAPVERPEPTEKDWSTGSPSNRWVGAKVALVARSGNCQTGESTGARSRKRLVNGVRWEDAEEPARDPLSVSSARYVRKGVTPGPPARQPQGCRMGPAREGLEADSHPSTATAGWN
jgi:hypothetical protein